MAARKAIELCQSRDKLDRDRGVQDLEQLMKAEDADGREIAAEIAALTQDEDLKASWEPRLGLLLAGKIVFKSAKDVNESDVDKMAAFCLTQLYDDSEARLRTAAGETLGVLAQRRPDEVFAASREILVRLIKETLQRDDDDAEATSAVHDTAGWRNLESSVASLRHLMEAVRVESVDGEILGLILKTLSHQNRFVRETGFRTLCAIINEKTSFDTSEVCLAIADGLADNWSQVRLAASEAARKFLFNVGKDELLMPRICLNRYYVAEGVRIHSQETWRRIAGVNGRQMVAENINDFIEYYEKASQADNHAVREAACHCIAELAAKVDREAVSPHVQRLLKTLLVCFGDDSWPVRDTACVAAGRFIATYPESCTGDLDSVFPLFVDNLKDPIASVRQGAAVAIANAMIAYPEDVLFERVRTILRDGFSGLKNQSAESARFTSSSEPENQVMYSCGSLAPKMGRGGCSDARFKKPSEPWEFSDGCVHLLAELLTSEAKNKFHSYLSALSSACSIRHYTMHYSFLETTLKRLPAMADGLGKRFFKPYLDDFMEPTLYACKSDNVLAKFAAEEFLRFLSVYLGPNILRGRIEREDARFVNVLEDVLLHDHERGHEAVIQHGVVSIPQGRRQQDEDAFGPHLGGTPT